MNGSVTSDDTHQGGAAGYHRLQFLLDIYFSKYLVKEPVINDLDVSFLIWFHNSGYLANWPLIRN